jgi:hypothetical protein
MRILPSRRTSSPTDTVMTSIVNASRALRPFKDMDFLSVYRDALGGANTESHLFAPDGQHGNGNRVRDYDALFDSATEHEHLRPSKSLEGCADRSSGLRKTQGAASTQG